MSREAPPVRAGQELDLAIVDLAFGGRGVARAGGFVVFVPGTLPGETARVRVRRVRPGYAEGICLEILARSPERVTPPCRHFGDCGGCDLQHLSRRAQGEAKGRQVAALLRRLAGQKDAPVEPALAAGEPTRYRFRMDFDWGVLPGGRAALGLHRAGRPQEILPIETCLLLPEPADAIRTFTARRAAGRRLAPWDPVRRRGLLRRLGIQMARATGEILLTLETGRGDPPGLAETARDLARAFPRIVGIVRREFDRQDRVLGESILHGRDHLFEEVDGDRFKIPAGAFFQPNATAWGRLRQAAVQALDPGPRDRVLEIFCGVGFFTLPVARRAGQVTAIDASREAVAAARDNAARAGVENARFLCRDADAALDGVLRETAFDAVLLDPPRAGLTRAATRCLAGAPLRRLVYVSCDPSTLARDLRILTGDGGWRLRSVAPIDLFPQTHHVECVARLDRVVS